MIKLTLYFKEKVLKVFQPKAELITIGRDGSCDIVIDNLALSPLHAEIKVNGKSATVLDKSEGEQKTGITINQKKVAEQELKNLDVIGLGKYSLNVSFQEEEAVPTAEPVFAPGEKQAQGWLQFMSGPKLGRTIKLDNPMIRLGKSGKTSAMISVRDGNYYISHLEGEPRTIVGNKELGDSRYCLQEGDTVKIGETTMMFFTD